VTSGIAQALYSLLQNRFTHGFYAEQRAFRKRNLPADRPLGALAKLNRWEVAQEIPPRAPSPFLPALPNATNEALEPVLALQALS